MIEPDRKREPIDWFLWKLMPDRRRIRRYVLGCFLTIVVAVAWMIHSDDRINANAANNARLVEAGRDAFCEQIDYLKTIQNGGAKYRRTLRLYQATDDLIRTLQSHVDCSDHKGPAD